MKQILFILALILAGVTACDKQDYVVDDIQNHEDYPEGTVERAVIDFHRSIHRNSRSNDEEPVIEGTTYRHYTVVGDTVMEVFPDEEATRSTSPDFSVSTTTFTVNGHKGYSIVGTTSTMKRVFFYTEKGLVSDTAYIEPLKEYVTTIPTQIRITISPNDWGLSNLQACDGISYPGGSPASPYHIENILETEWHQGWPYNLYAPECTCSECAKILGHNPIGCVTIAIAQAIAKYGKFTGTYYGNRNLSFDILRTGGGSPEQIAAFCHEVALGCQIRFGCSGGASDPKAGYQYLRDIGYNVSYDEGKEISMSRLASGLRANFPHPVGGKKSALKAGHMWLITGIKYEKGEVMYFCNWGWRRDRYNNTSNGWVHGNYWTAPTPEGHVKYKSNLKHIYLN